MNSRAVFFSGCGPSAEEADGTSDKVASARSMKQQFEEGVNFMADAEKDKGSVSALTRAKTGKENSFPRK